MAKDIWNSKNYKQYEPKDQKRFRGHKIVQNNHSRTCIRCLTRSLGAKNAIDFNLTIDPNDPRATELDAQAFQVKEEEYDLFLCEKCWNLEFQKNMQSTMYECGNCGCWFEVFSSDLLHPQRASVINHNCQMFNWNFKVEDSMLYIHYEVMSIAADLVAASEGSLEPEMIKLKFSSSNQDCFLNFKRDGAKMNELITVMKQIPASHRTFDPVDYIWTIPRSKFDVLKMLANIQHPGRHQFLSQHPDLHAFIYPPKVQEKSWADQIKDSAKFKTEAAEEFFRNIPAEGVLDKSTLESKLSDLMGQYVTAAGIKLIAGKSDRSEFMRAYKLTARRLHPDFGGDAAKMSELNMLFNQYKEVAK